MGFMKSKTVFKVSIYNNDIIFSRKKIYYYCSVYLLELKTSSKSLARLLTCGQVEKSQTCNRWKGLEQTSSLFHWVCLLARGASISK